jgi:hypothetical protein
MFHESIDNFKLYEYSCKCYYENVKDEMVRVEELESVKVELQKVISDKTISKKMFKVV